LAIGERQKKNAQVILSSAIIKANMLKSKYAAWREEIAKHENDLVLALFLGTLALILNMLSGRYVERVGAAQPEDLILDHLPVIDLSFIYVWLMILVLAVYFIYPFLYHPNKIHYAIGLFSLFILIRAGFVVLTHLKIPVEAITDISWSPFFYDFFSFNNYLFFSGHVGAPFLGFLMFKSKKMKVFMLASSIILAATVLFMHVHYSIDVLAAYFITYTIYKMGDFMFGNGKEEKV